MIGELPKNAMRARPPAPCDEPDVVEQQQRAAVHAIGDRPAKQ
jgi:hypothetical protein